jgi:hypothetical protein
LPSAPMESESLLGRMTEQRESGMLTPQRRSQGIAPTDVEIEGAALLALSL